MSGPIRPPLRVRDTDSSPNVIPVNTIIVSDGDLVDDGGATVTIDTSGAGGLPGSPAKAVQFNSDPAGTFTGDAGFIVSTAGGGATTVAGIGNLLVGANKVAMNAVNGTISLMSEGTGEILLRSSSDAGGTFTDSIVNIMSNANTDDAQLKFRDSANTDNGSITLDGSGHMILNNNVAAKDIDLKVLTTGQVEVANQTTDTDTVLSIMGNGTGAPRIDMQNASKRVWIECQTNKKLTVQGGAAGNTFVFDVSSATGGIQFPDGTSLVSAEGTAILATGVTDDYVLTADGAGAAAWEAAGGGGATTLSGLTDVLIDATNWTDSILIQPNSDGLAPTTGVLSSAENNVGIGANALLAITQADGVIAIGQDAGKAITNGAGSVIIGQEAGAAGNPGTSVLIGARAGKGGVGNSSIHIGANSGLWATGFQNVHVGGEGGNSVSGYRNVSLGHGALGTGTGLSGVGNIGIGYIAGNNGVVITSGSDNVIIGAADVADGTADDQLSISNGATGDVIWIAGDSAGACYQGDNASTWSTTSDQRLKREIVDSLTGLDAINAVQVRNFRYVEHAEPITEIRTDSEGEEREAVVGYEGENRYHLDPEPLRVGVIAQEVQDVFPEAVTENAHGHLTVNTDSINWALLKAVQELSAKVEVLEGSQ